MLAARTPVLLGRWGTRDFLRGRSKRGGAVHIRHTHGSKGRYKRLSTLYGIRDGRRHGGNRLKGGLGVKLGGGLFGLRIPRQHALATMTREQFELEVYGHPNITNPYRECLEAHPGLRAVMANAAPRATLMVLLPRAPRHPRHTCKRGKDLNDGRENGDGGAARDAEDAEAAQLPAQWTLVGEGLATLLAGTTTTTAAASFLSLHTDAPEHHGSLARAVPSCVTTLSLCTLDSTVQLNWDAKPRDASLARHDILTGLTELFHEYQKGRTLPLAEAEANYNGASSFSPSSSQPSVAPSAQTLSAAITKPFLGANLRVPTTVATRASSSVPTPSGSLSGAALSLATRPTPILQGTATGKGGRAKLEAMAAQVRQSVGVPCASKTVRATTTVAAAHECEASEGNQGRSGSAFFYPSLSSSATAASFSDSCTAIEVPQGITVLWRTLKQRQPDALCLCLRPSSLASFSPASSLSSSSAHHASEDTEAHRDESPNASANANDHNSSDVTNATVRPDVLPNGAKATPPLLKKDTDKDETVGVWLRQPRGSASQLLRWAYSTHDPRAHSSDAIPHDQRRLPVLLLVDASKLSVSAQLQPSSPGTVMPIATSVKTAAPTGSEGELLPSLLSHQVSEELGKAGFHALSDPTLPHVVQAMRSWTTERQWAALQALKE